LYIVDIEFLHAIKNKILKSETYLREKTNLTDDELKMCQSFDQ